MSENQPISIISKSLKQNGKSQGQSSSAQNSPVPCTSSQIGAVASTSAATSEQVVFAADDFVECKPVEVAPLSSEDSDADKENTESPPEEFQGYAGISSDSINIYAEQSNYEHLTDEMCNILAEDINYKLRYIIYHSLLKAKVQGRKVITADDIDETFSEQQIDRVYGASMTPNWIHFQMQQPNSKNEDSLYFLDDQPVDLIEIAEREETFSQGGTHVITQVWSREPIRRNINVDIKTSAEHSADDIEGAQPSSDTSMFHSTPSPEGALPSEQQPSEQEGEAEEEEEEEDQSEESIEDLYAEYFQISVNAIISNDEDVKRMALIDISENPLVGPIIHWFYNFSYLLLTKDVTYDNALTLRALKLIEVLENSPLSSQNVSAKHIKLLVKILLQRLLRFPTTFYSKKEIETPILRPLCYVLSLLCLRNSVKQIVVEKIESKLITDEIVLPFVTIIYFLGYEAIENLFLPHIDYFLSRVVEENQSSLTEIILTIFWVICKCRLDNEHIYYAYRNVYGYAIIPYLLPKCDESLYNDNRYLKNEIWPITDHRRKKLKSNFTRTKINSIKSKRKILIVKPKAKPTEVRNSIENAFDLPLHDCIIRKNLDQFRNKEFATAAPEQFVVVGKLNFLLPIFRSHRKIRCMDHSIIVYNI